MAGFLDNIKSLAPGGKKANWGGLGKNVATAAYELSGVGDIKRGAAELGKGNVLGGLGRIGLGAVGFLPGAGWALRGATAASKLGKGSKFVTAATKTKPVQAATKPLTTVAKTKPVQAITRPVQAAGSKASKGIQAGAAKASKPLVGAGAKTRTGKFVAGVTSPYTISRIISEFTIPPQAPNIFDAAQRSWEQTQLAASLMGTNVPKTGGGTPGAGGGTPTPSVGGGSGPGGTGPGTSVTPGYGPGPEGAGIPEIVVPPLGGGIGVGGGTGETGTSEINTGGEESLMGGTGEMMVGTPGEVAKAGAQYGAGLAGIAAQNRLRDAGLRELFSQGMMGVRGTAADILGGRSAAIRGQGVTGVRRAFQTGLAQAAQDRMAEESALARTYGSEVAAGYQKAAQDVMDLAQRRSEAAARIRSLG